MVNSPRISDAEWRVMEMAWQTPGASAQEIIEALSGTNDWSAATVKTMLNRLVRKGALRFQKDGKSYRYFPAISAEACRGAEAENFLQRVFNGSMTPMLAHFVKTKRFSKAEITELENLLRESKK